MKQFYLFLDFDGVVNVFYEPGTPKYEQVIAQQTYFQADRDCVQWLNRLVKHFSLKIVITSSWRWNGLVFCKQHLVDGGFLYPEQIVDMTSLNDHISRDTLILDYIQNHDIEVYAVLDDLDLPELNGHMFQTKPHLGIDESIYQNLYLYFSHFLP